MPNIRKAKSRAKNLPARSVRLYAGMRLYFGGHASNPRTLARVPGEPGLWQVLTLHGQPAWSPVPPAEMRGLLRRGTYTRTLRRST